MEKCKLILNFEPYHIELFNDNEFNINSVDNYHPYDFVYNDDEAHKFQCSQHAIKVFIDGQIYKSAIVCAVAGKTTIHSKSAVIDGKSIFISCANKVFSLSLPDLTLNWMTQVDMATCFGIYKADNGIFTHGELSVTRLDYDGIIVWETGLKDIIVRLGENYEQDDFVIQETHISLVDYSSNKYKLGFDGKFISIELSE